MASSDLHLGLVKLGNSVPVQDLIKANANDDRRVQHLRQLLLSQLDLIQKQSEVIASKDQQIRELKRQNENLQNQLEQQQPKSSKSRKQAKKSLENTIEEIELKQNEEQEEGILTENPYFTLQNHQINEDIEEIEVDKKAASEVPKWRIKQIQPSYIMEGTEDIEDVTMLKRHNKPENDEKRRKRWDVQRIRERAHVARLRARSHDEGSHEMQELNNTELKTLIPDPEEALEICVQEKIPVTVFGCLLPNLAPADFSLPWLES